VNPDPAAAGSRRQLGASVVGKHHLGSDSWTVLQDPEANGFCVGAKSFTG
jgi:hypothetical protein